VSSARMEDHRRGVSICCLSARRLIELAGGGGWYAATVRNCWQDRDWEREWVGTGNASDRRYTELSPMRFKNFWREASGLPSVLYRQR
jgi:hypothetical protein